MAGIKIICDFLKISSNNFPNQLWDVCIGFQFGFIGRFYRWRRLGGGCRIDALIKTISITRLQLLRDRRGFDGFGVLERVFHGSNLVDV